MYFPLSLCIYIYIYICIHIHTYIHTHICRYRCICRCNPTYPRNGAVAHPARLRVGRSLGGTAGHAPFLGQHRSA